MSAIIEVNQISKKYKIGHKQALGSESLLPQLARLARHPLSAFNAPKDDFWALKDVSFAVERGDVVGIVGRNGSGKSTLLKVLSRITEPTSGEAILRGRVASLLEVGTGFHPELTGRENIYFNGSILGMTKKEIDSKFREIVDFSEVEKFIDTPVKFYSSGMYVRLAFAVAAHLDPDILIVDEVLAVGDAEFQKKSLGKMRHAASEGRTVLFVSHSISAVRQLCNKAILVDKGQLVTQGSIEDVLASYLSRQAAPSSSAAVKITNSMYDRGSDKMEFLSATISGSDGRPSAEIHYKDSIQLDIKVRVNEELKNGRFGIALQTADGQMITINCITDAFESSDKDVPVGDHIYRVSLPNVLNPGKYILGISAYEAVTAGGASVYVPSAIVFDVLPYSLTGQAAPPSNTALINLDIKWSEL